MKRFLLKLFSPILKPFENGDGPYKYRASHRTILVVVGILFLALASASAMVSISAKQAGAILPTLVFFSAGTVCIVVGSLGSDKAVAKIWGSK